MVILTIGSQRASGRTAATAGKLYFHGTVSTQEDANKSWNAIKRIADWPVVRRIVDTIAPRPEGQCCSSRMRPTAASLDARLA